MYKVLNCPGPYKATPGQLSWSLLLGIGIALFYTLWPKASHINWAFPDFAFLPLLAFGLGIFIFLVYVNWWLLRLLWLKLGLPPFNELIIHFNTMQPWQQIASYWASFALLFLGSLLSLMAIL
jgi:hypothetical protein